MTSCDMMDRYQKIHFTEPINTAFEDPFWCNIYRPLFLEQLEEKHQIAAATRDRIAYEIDSYLQEGIAACFHATRSEAHLFLMNVKTELEDQTDLDHGSTEIYFF